jgi:UDP-glucose 4-epimerase
MTGKRVLITGGAGFIGANLAKGLLDSGSAAEVRIIDDLSSGRLDNLTGMDVNFCHASVLDGSRVRAMAQDCDTVVHLAAVPNVARSVSDPMRTHNANTTGTLHVLEAARAVGAHVILASSSSVYGANPILPKSEDLRCMPMSPYAVSKLATEAYGLAYAYCYQLRVLAFRFFNVFGPMQSADHAYAAVVPAFISAALQEQPVSIHGDGTQTRDFTFVGTVVQTIESAVRRSVTHEDAVNLAFGTRVSLLELIGLLERALGRRIRREHGANRVGDIRDSQADGRCLRLLFPDVMPVPLDAALGETIRWFTRSSDRGTATAGD